MNRQQLIAIVRAAAQPIATDFGRPLAYEAKEGRLEAAAAVTAIDRAIQAQLMTALGGNFIGEEDGHRLTGSSFIWLVDPMDGTGARIRGLASSTCIVTLMEVHDGGGTPILAVIYNPVTQQTWSAEAGYGAYYQYQDGVETRCVLDRHASVPEKIHSTIALWPGTDYRFNEVRAAVTADKRFDHQSFGALGAAHASVISGTSHLSACRSGAAYETAAATLMVKEAGGAAWDLDGGSLSHGTFPLQDTGGKVTFTIPKGAILASCDAVALEFLQLVRDINRSEK